MYNAAIVCVLKDDILKYLGLHQRVRPCQIRHDYYLSRTRIHQVLKELLNEGKVVKSGKVPKVYYHMVRNRGFKI